MKERTVRTFAMTWIPKLRRWAKRYRGVQYTVSCRQLGCAETKEASWKLANEWWRGKKAEIDQADRPPAPDRDRQKQREEQRLRQQQESCGHCRTGERSRVFDMVVRASGFCGGSSDRLHTKRRLRPEYCVFWYWIPCRSLSQRGECI